MLDLTEYEQFAQLAQELEPQDEVYSGFDKFNQLDAPDMDIPLMEHLEFFEDPSSDDGEYNNAAFEWLTSKCVEVHRKNGRSDTPEQFEAAILDMLQSNRSSDELQMQLLEEVGYDDVDFVIELLEKRNDLKISAAAALPNGYSLMTPEQKAQQLRDNRARAKALPDNPVPTQKKYPNVYMSGDGGNVLSSLGKKYGLPVGSEKLVFNKHEEIIVPYPKKRPVLIESNFIPLKDLDIICRGAFKAYKSLNQIQSLVYPVAYNTSENMLVCAPTGAGKTDVAMLTVLSTINQFSDISPEGDVTVHYNDFKIVYVAPLKALAAEIVVKLGKRLAWLGISVRELTGDMQLTKAEIMATQVIVTTPEKWDVVTRKSTGDNELVTKVKLLIIDEVHLLHEDRGAVIESLVARTLRQVESTQSLIRIVGLSATLPNFIDVAQFLRVNPEIGMFFFDSSFRPVPLEQHFIGVRGKQGSNESRENIDEIAYEKLVQEVGQGGHQVMVFVHSRKDTAKSAMKFVQAAQANGESEIFSCATDPNYGLYTKDVMKAKNKEVRELFQHGFGIHHAGMLRSDRNLTEKLFADGLIKVLCCTATLAWGVNLPAAVVIIKGTQVYEAKKGGFTDLGISDVIQIFGRAGRPQFEKFGTGILLTSLDRLSHFISAVTEQHPIESKLQDQIVDNLNAEISLGTVTNVDEGVAWLGYTYLFVRMRKNPLAYGLTWADVQDDPMLGGHRRKLIVAAAQRLHTLQMIVFDERVGSFVSKDSGRVASDFYLLNNSIEIFNTMMKPDASEADVLALLSMSGEFDGLKGRPEEMEELEKFQNSDDMPCQPYGALTTTQGKTNLVLQAYISRYQFKESSLISDMGYVAQNASRIARALFSLALNRRWGNLAYSLLSMCKAIDQRLWPFAHPLHQFELPDHIMRILDAKDPSIDDLRDMTAKEMGDLVHNHSMASKLYRFVDRFPYMMMEADIAPITKSVLRVHLDIWADFHWDEKYHGKVQHFWLWVESSDNAHISHVEKFMLSKRKLHDVHNIDFTIPISQPIPSQIVVRLVSDHWAHVETVQTVSFKHLIMPDHETIHTKLLRLRPLPIEALRNPIIENIYAKKFQFFNPMQTMCFHCLYHMDTNVFLGSPTGSGKTVACELAMWAAFRDNPGSKVVYIAPMKALVRERVEDWGKRLKGFKRIVELTGDSNPDAGEVRRADIIITTPEKFDGISRNWKTRKFVQGVSLVIMDEIHLLASDRGPILEMIVSRMNYVGGQTGRKVRLLGLSTAVSNTTDMAGWLGVKEGLFNFPPAVRPVPLQMYIDGFPDNVGFCPLMKTMNKPAFMAIKSHSPTKPVLIFVASRRQTRLTSLDLIHLCGLEDNPRRFLSMDEDELQAILLQVKDETLKLSLQFGIGLHHAGLVESDRRISHELFAANRIQILIATSTLAWGVNLPAHLVVIKGTQFYDAKIEAYRDMDLTDILQMMGRAGRPGFDTNGIAMVYTKESKKAFYKNFLNVGFPVESQLHKALEDHLGAEIVTGSIKSRQDAMDFLSWTFLYRRVYSNPTYYGIQEQTPEAVGEYLSDLIDDSLDALSESSCLQLHADGTLSATSFLRISSYYYLSHKTVRFIISDAANDSTFRDALVWVSKATEYDLLPVRHNEDLVNAELSKEMRYSGESMDLVMWDPHVKVFLLLQAYMSRVKLPITDYIQDTVSVLDQTLRILQAAVDTVAELGLLFAVKTAITVMQCIKQGAWPDADPVTLLPGMKPQDRAITKFEERDEITLDTLGNMSPEKIKTAAQKFGCRNINDFVRVASSLPVVDIDYLRVDDKMTVTMTHKNKPLHADFRMPCPKFHKPQKESWFVILSCGEDLLGIKRVSPQPGKPMRTELKIPPGYETKNLILECINDALDLSYDIEVQV
ncbi:RNA helicase related to Ski2p, putative [Yarrowia lipolytica]|nr:RNA helicase related to Ski2p, putative [Yarrowia lipolytica]